MQAVNHASYNCNQLVKLEFRLYIVDTEIKSFEALFIKYFFKEMPIINLPNQNLCDRQI